MLAFANCEDNAPFYKASCFEIQIFVNFHNFRAEIFTNCTPRDTPEPSAIRKCLENVVNDVRKRGPN